MKRFMRAMLGFDHAANTLTERLCRRLTRITGKSNFYLARAALAVGYVLMVVQCVYDYTVEPSEGNAFWGVFVTAVWTWMIRQYWREFREIEEDAQSLMDGATTIPIRLVTRIEGLIFNRCIWGAWCLVGLAMRVSVMRPPGAGHIGFICATLSLYFVVQFNQGGKSVVKRAIEKAKALKDKVVDAIPQPAPRPVPIPVRG